MNFHNPRKLVLVLISQNLSRLQSDSPPRRMSIENCAFHHGVSVREVMKALGVVLRNKIFALKGLSIDGL